MSYIYVSSTSKETGKPTERELWRKGETVELANLGEGRGLLIRYDQYTATATSPVVKIDEDHGRLTIETLNTVYVFDEERIG